MENPATTISTLSRLDHGISIDIQNETRAGAYDNVKCLQQARDGIQSAITALLAIRNANKPA